ncbi:MAG: hypothetical protein WEA76_12185 [Acidimicrobiia bacterium]
MITQRTHMSQTPGQTGLGARAAVRIAPPAAPVAFCNSVVATTDAGGTLTPHRRTRIE